MCPPGSLARSCHCLLPQSLPQSPPACLPAASASAAFLAASGFGFGSISLDKFSYFMLRFLIYFSLLLSSLYFRFGCLRHFRSRRCSSGSSGGTSKARLVVYSCNYSYVSGVSAESSSSRGGGGAWQMSKTFLNIVWL